MNKSLYVCSAIGIDGNQKPNKMIKAFYIFKQGVTKDWVTILIPIDDFTDELLQFKIEKYKFLGFQIKNI